MIGVSGIGVYVPEGRVTSADIAAASGLPAWVVTDKLGISAKPKPGPDDHPTAMGVWAAERALSASGLSPEDVDVVICITEEYKEYPVWTAGIKLAHDLGAANAYAYDIGQKCGTGVLGLKQAKDLLLADDSVQTVLVAGATATATSSTLGTPTCALCTTWARAARRRWCGGGRAVKCWVKSWARTSSPMARSRSTCGCPSAAPKNRSRSRTRGATVWKCPTPPG